MSAMALPRPSSSGSAGVWGRAHHKPVIGAEAIESFFRVPRSKADATLVSCAQRMARPAFGTIGAPSSTEAALRSVPLAFLARKRLGHAYSEEHGIEQRHGGDLQAEVEHRMHADQDRRAES